MKYTTKQLRKAILKYPDDFALPQEACKKYNTIHSVIDDKETPGGRAWIMWFLDELDKEK